MSHRCFGQCSEEKLEEKMTWFLLTLACIILWSVTDVLYRASFTRNDPLAYCKSFVWVGLVMALAGFIMSTWSDTLLDSLKILKDDVLHLVPLCLIYAFAWFFGLMGSKHLEASVVSPLENIDGALTAIICYYYLLTGYIRPSNMIGVMDVIATMLIIIGIVLIGIEEQALKRKEMHLSKDKKKHRFGALALLFPIIYTLIDVFSTVEISGILTQGSETSIPAMDFFIFECAGFAFVAIFVWLYMLVVKKYTYNPFEEEELIRCGAATGETAGTMAFIFAASINPVLTAPVTSLYCLVTIVLARIFLKERLTKKQYLSIGFLVVGIILIGISEILSV
jgi:drug/metabolite transporter (DMT)-like permease